MAKQKIKGEKHNTKQAPAVKPKANSAPQGVSFFNQFWVQAVLLTLICFIFYANTFRNGYAVDDFLVLEKNEAVNRGVAGIPKLLTSDIFDSYYQQYNANNRLGGGRYRPLALISYALEQQAFGKATNKINNNALTNDSKLLYVRHVNNVLLYILSVIALLYFLRKVIFPTLPVVAFLSVLLFAIHPIHTEVVANIKGRDEILSLLFITLTLISACKYMENKKTTSLLLALFCFFMALLAKEYAVSLIVLIPFIFYLFKNHTLLNSLKTAIPYLAVLVLYIFIRFSFVPFTSGPQENDLLNNPYLLASGTQKIASQIATLIQYIKLLVWPYSLSVDYSYNQIPYQNLSDITPWLSFLLHVLLIAGLVYCIKNKNVLAFAIAFYLFNLLLVSNLLFNIGATMGERLIYHSSLGFSIALAYIMYWAYRQIKPRYIATGSVAAFTLLLVVLAGIQTKARNKDWESNSTLFRKDVLTSSNSAVTNANAGNAYLQLVPLQNTEEAKKQMLDTALVYLNKAITIYPRFTLAYINRGNVFFQQGNLERAKQDWDTAQQQYPTYPDLPGLFASYYINTAVNKLGKEGKYNEAINALNKGAALEPKNTILLFNLGYYYNLVGKNDSAINAFQKIIAINPSDTLATKCAGFIDILKKASRPQ